MKSWRKIRAPGVRLDAEQPWAPFRYGPRRFRRLGWRLWRWRMAWKRWRCEANGHPFDGTAAIDGLRCYCGQNFVLGEWLSSEHVWWDKCWAEMFEVVDQATRGRLEFTERHILLDRLKALRDPNVFVPKEPS